MSPPSVNLFKKTECNFLESEMILDEIIKMMSSEINFFKRKLSN